MIERIKEALRDRGWNDREFCRLLCRSQSEWSRMQSGQRSVKHWAFLGAVGKVLPELQLHIVKLLFEGE